jgi:hypothetical protein
MKSPGIEFFTYPIQKFTFFFGAMTTFKFASLKGICTAGQSHAEQLYICIYIERRGVSSIGKIISHTLLSTRRDTKETNGVKKKPKQTNEKSIASLFSFSFFIYFFDGLPRVPYEFLFPELEPTLGMSVLLLGRGKVNDSPTPSRGFQIGDPSGLAAAGV